MPFIKLFDTRDGAFVCDPSIITAVSHTPAKHSVEIYCADGYVTSFDTRYQKADLADVLQTLGVAGNGLQRVSKDMEYFGDINSTIYFAPKAVNMMHVLENNDGQVRLCITIAGLGDTVYRDMSMAEVQAVADLVKKAKPMLELDGKDVTCNSSRDKAWLDLTQVYRVEPRYNENLDIRVGWKGRLEVELKQLNIDSILTPALRDVFNQQVADAMLAQTTIEKRVQCMLDALAAKLASGNPDLISVSRGEKNVYIRLQDFDFFDTSDVEGKNGSPNYYYLRLLKQKPAGYEGPDPISLYFKSATERDAAMQFLMDAKAGKQQPKAAASKQPKP